MVAGVVAAADLMRIRRFQEGLATAVVVVCALRQLGQQNWNKTFERLMAWDRRETQRLERRVQHKGHRAKHAA